MIDNANFYAGPAKILGRINLSLVLIELLITLIYLGLFLWVVYEGEGPALNALMLLRAWLLPIWPFLLLIQVFLIALWIYTMYIGLGNKFSRFVSSPHQALYAVLFPLINIFGFGLKIVGISNFIDRYYLERRRLEWMSRNLKYVLGVFYAGFTGFSVSLPWSLYLSLDLSFFTTWNGIGFNLLQIFLLLALLVGLAGILNITHRVLAYRGELSKFTHLSWWTRSEYPVHNSDNDYD